MDVNSSAVESEDAVVLIGKAQILLECGKVNLSLSLDCFAER